ncbi:APC family permease [Longimicrobium sp.]|uniref:APC family permease n=1 Tax=Longimicrobium sp. TaxID=2029185 RepID=UPI002C65AACB|nr:APC family permease [Longimicrobium sp.]HSU16903.1 APC family permease [Longimicrobium sp.]
MAEGERDKAPGLRRELGLSDAVGIGFGAIVGAGIFAVTGIAAGVAGPAVLLALPLAGVAATANALSSAELAASYPQAGGTYEYGYRVLHPWAGFAAGWMFLASKTAAAGTVGLAIAAYLERIAPGLPGRAVAVVAVVLFTAVNALGIRKSSAVNLGIVAVATAVLLAFSAVGVARFDASHLHPLMPPSGAGGVLRAAALLFFAYTGYARVATLGEEVREPRRTIPRAILITVAGVSVLYLLVTAAAVGSVGAEVLARTDAPLAEAARAMGMPELEVIVSAGAVCAMLGVLLSQLLGLSRMVFAMARRGDLPRPLAKVDARSGAPRRAVVLVGAGAALAAAFGTLRAIAPAASFAILLYYALANLAALRMPREGRLYPDAVPAVGLAACALLAASIPPRTMGVGIAVLAAGFIVRAAARTLAGPAGGD